MTGRQRRHASLTPCLAALLFFASDALALEDREALQRALEERSGVEAQLEVLRRAVPAEFEQGVFTARLRKLAEEAEIPDATITVEPAPTPLPIGGSRPSPVLLHGVRIAGSGPYQRVDRFLQYASIAIVGARFDHLTIESARDATVRFELRLVFPSFEPQRPGEIPRGRVVAAIREETDHLRAVVTALADFLAPGSSEVVNALAVLTRELDGDAVALTKIGWDGDLEIAGFLVGTEARGALSDALRASALATTARSGARSGRCESFLLSLRLQPDATGLPREVVLDNGAFDAGAAAACAPPPSKPASMIRVRAAAAAPDGGAALRLRNVDVDDLFFVLNDLLNQHYAIDPALEGRVSLEVPVGGTVEETLAAIGAAGFSLGSGSVRLVTRGNPASRAVPRIEGGDPVSFVMKRAAASQLLCIVSELSGREIRVPAGLSTRVSVFAFEVGLDALLEGIAAASGLTGTESGEALVLRTAGGSPGPMVNACENTVAAGPESFLERVPLLAHRLGAADLELAGLARVGDSWRAYAYGPTRHLLPLETGVELLDARVSSIGPDGVTLRTEAKGETVLRFAE